MPSLVSVDTVVVEHNERYLLDGRRLLRSALSFRIADVPSHVLARSVFESLGDYAANAVRRLLRDWKVDVVCGMRGRSVRAQRVDRGPHAQGPGATHAAGLLPAADRGGMKCA